MSYRPAITPNCKPSVFNRRRPTSFIPKPTAEMNMAGFSGMYSWAKNISGYAPHFSTGVYTDGSYPTRRAAAVQFQELDSFNN